MAAEGNKRHSRSDWKAAWESADGKPKWRGQDVEASHVAAYEVAKAAAESEGLTWEPAARRSLIPLAGDTIMTNMLHYWGHPVVAVEMVPLGIQQMKETSFPDVEFEEEGAYSRSVNIEPPVTMWCGNFFEYPVEENSFGFIYDRQSYGALSIDTRPKFEEVYARALPADGILSVYGCDRFKTNEGWDTDGPPFNLTEEAIVSVFVPERWKLLAVEKHDNPNTQVEPESIKWNYIQFVFKRL